MKQQNNILDKIERRNPFTTPENYFDQLSDKLESKIDMLENNDEKATKKRAIWLSFKPLLQVAAAVLILFGISFTVVQIHTSGLATPKTLTQEIEIESTEEYEYLIEEIELEEMYDYLSMN